MPYEASHGTVRSMETYVLTTPQGVLEARHVLGRAGRVCVISDHLDEDELQEVLTALGSSVQVIGRVTPESDPRFPHVVQGVRVTSQSSSFMVRAARSLAGGEPFLWCGDHVVAVREALGLGELLVSPELRGDERFAEHGRQELIKKVFHCDASVMQRGSALWVNDVETVDASSWLRGAVPTVGGVGGDEMLRSIRTAARRVPENVLERLLAFQDEPHNSGALLLKRCPLGELPATPETPTAPCEKTLESEHTLLSVARILGQPVGYLPEHGGELVQNILPTREGADRQVSTSSKVTLQYHTEASFHPWRMRYLLLLCLRGDENAKTTLVSARDIVRRLDEATMRVLAEPLFSTGIDESYAGSRSTARSEMHSVLYGSKQHARIRYDAELTEGVTAAAQHALTRLAEVVRECEGGVVLEAGDLLIVDNTVAIHGRSPFTPRFDGTDRWLQRAFVMSDLLDADGELNGRIVSTQFRG
jgi:L-asparagine oxygenase